MVGYRKVEQKYTYDCFAKGDNYLQDGGGLHTDFHFPNNWKPEDMFVTVSLDRGFGVQGSATINSFEILDVRGPDPASIATIFQRTFGVPITVDLNMADIDVSMLSDSSPFHNNFTTGQDKNNLLPAVICHSPCGAEVAIAF
jgi:hypothetical protein